MLLEQKHDRIFEKRIESIFKRGRRRRAGGPVVACTSFTPPQSDEGGARLGALWRSQGHKLSSVYACSGGKLWLSGCHPSLWKPTCPGQLIQQ